MPLTPKEMCRLLEQNGFVCIRSNGSHRMYSNPVTKKVHCRSLSCKGSEARSRKKVFLNKPESKN